MPTLLHAPRRCSLLPCAVLSPALRCVLAAQISNHAPHWNLPQVLHPPGGDSSGCAGGRHRTAGLVCAVAGRAAFCRVPPCNRAGRQQWCGNAGGRNECGSGTGAGAAGTSRWQRRTGRCRLSSSACHFMTSYPCFDTLLPRACKCPAVGLSQAGLCADAGQAAGRQAGSWAFQILFLSCLARRNGCLLRLLLGDALQLLLLQC